VTDSLRCIAQAQTQPMAIGRAECKGSQHSVCILYVLNVCFILYVFIVLLPLWRNIR